MVWSAGILSVWKHRLDGLCAGARKVSRRKQVLKVMIDFSGLEPGFLLCRNQFEEIRSINR